MPGSSCKHIDIFICSALFFFKYVNQLSTLKKLRLFTYESRFLDYLGWRGGREEKERCDSQVDVHMWQQRLELAYAALAGLPTLLPIHMKVPSQVGHITNSSCSPFHCRLPPLMVELGKKCVSLLSMSPTKVEKNKRSRRANYFLPLACLTNLYYLPGLSIYIFV